MAVFPTWACVALLLAATCSVVLAQQPPGTVVPVGVDNYIRAQSDVYFGQTVKAGAFGRFRHGRELAPVASRGIVRPNRDTLYSFAVFDFDAGPVTVTLPDAGNRFMVMQVVNEDQYTPAVYYGAGRYTLTKEGIGTRYGIVAVRMLVDPAKPQDVQQVHALQDALTASQQSRGTFEIPNWDGASLNKVRGAHLLEACPIPVGDLECAGTLLAHLERILQGVDLLDILRVRGIDQHAHDDKNVSHADPLLGPSQRCAPRSSIRSGSSNGYSASSRCAITDWRRTPTA